MTIKNVCCIQFSFRNLFAFVACGLLAFSAAADTGAIRAETPAKAFRAGAFAADITPPKFPISVNGNMQDHFAKGAHDPLHARCLVLDDGTTRVAIVVCDLCAVPREVFDEAKQLASAASKIPTSHMLMSATHTHSAPTVTAVFQSEPDREYQKYLARQIALGIEKASGQLEPARIGWGVAKNSSQVFNRRWKMKPGTIAPSPLGAVDLVKMNPGIGNPNLIEPAGPIDPEVSVLAVQALDGRPIALLANYSLHYVGGVPGDVVSADYYGAFADRITQLVGAGKADPPFVGIMSNGTSGDINNVNFAQMSAPKRVPFEQIKVVADSVAQTAFEAYQQIKFHDSVPLAARETELELAVRRPTDEELARAKKILAEAKGPVLKTLPDVYAREQVLLSSYPAQVRLKLQALRIGGLGIAAIPCEVFVEIGLALKQQSPLKPMFTIELANGYNGYLPTAAQHKLGGYETWRARSSYLEAGAADKILPAVLQLLQDATGK